MHREHHIKIGRYVRDIVFAANDGLVTTFAVVAGVVGADLSPFVIIAIGLANLVADGFSMATGNYLGIKSEIELYQREEGIEKEEIQRIPDHEKLEVREILEKKGYKGADLEQMLKLVTGNKRHWIDFMMHEEMGLVSPETEHPIKKAMVTFISFAIAGAIPLLPYTYGAGEDTFLVASIMTGSALFIIGALRTYFSDRNWFVSGVEMLLVGGSAASMAYLIGYLIRAFTG